MYKNQTDQITSPLLVNGETRYTLLKPNDKQQGIILRRLILRAKGGSKLDYSNSLAFQKQMLSCFNHIITYKAHRILTYASTKKILSKL